MSEHSDDAIADEESSAPQRSTLAAAEDRSQRRREVAGLQDDTARATTWLLVAVLVQLVFGAIAYSWVTQHGDAQLARVADLADSERVLRSGREWLVADYRAVIERDRLLGVAIPFGVAGIFLLLYLWARKSPIPALITALFLFLIGHVASELLVFSSILVVTLKALFCFALVKGISSAMVRRTILNAQQPLA
tara:strand:- start:444 stop:1022 length:579 start_codon:yes stop_codon:yes gene_type:complete